MSLLLRHVAHIIGYFNAYQRDNVHSVIRSSTQRQLLRNNWLRALVCAPMHDRVRIVNVSGPSRKKYNFATAIVLQSS